MMKDEMRDQHWTSSLALPASGVLHLAIVALLIFGLPKSFPKPQDEQAVAVELVPPPKPPEKAPEEPKAEPPAKKPEPKPEKPRPETPKPEKPPEAQVEPPTPAPEQPIRRLNPVVQFGEKDAGPRKALDGDSAEESSTKATDQENPEKPESQNEKPVEPPAVIAVEKDASPSLPQTATQKPTPKPAEIAEPRKAPKLQDVKKLYSRSATDDPVATTAMRGVPRDVRGGTLCVTELREQLYRASPPYFPDLLPSFRLKEGTTLDVPGAAFRVGGQWRALSYRCEVDANVTRVESFAFRIGGLIPRSEWQRLGLPTR
ncbi:hypothetical protein ASD27_07470 [Mesorhizobium sp. Root1471]|nr:hypothetical protein ASD27_07470 [Mesorhizobium sp. Root1471]